MRFVNLWKGLNESCDWRQGVGFGALAGYLMLLGVSPVFTTASTLVFSSWRTVLLISAVLFLLVFLTFLYKKPSFLEGKRLLYCAFLGELLTLLGLGVSLLTEGLFATELLSASCTSLGMLLLILSWAKPFTETKLRGRVIATAMSAIIGCLLYFLVIFLPESLAFIAGIFLTMVSVFFFFLIWSQHGYGNTPKQTPPLTSMFGSKKRAGFPYARDIVISAIVYGCLFTLSGHALPELENQWLTTKVPGLINIGAFFLAQILIAFYMTKISGRESPDVAYRPVILFMALGFGALPLSSGVFTFICMAFILAGFGCALVFLWIVMGNTCQRYNILPGQVYTLGILYILLGMLLGELFVSGIIALGISGLVYTVTITSSGLLLLIFILWQKTSGAAYANETFEMGGQFFGGDESPLEGAALAIIAQYRLSAREAEVFQLWVNGRDIPYICDELFIAKDTVKTHLKHIYEKTNTSGKQELIDLVAMRASERRL